MRAISSLLLYIDIYCRKINLKLLNIILQNLTQSYIMNII